MKCLFVASNMNFGGAERVMSILSNAWCDKGCEVKILLTGTPAQSKYTLSKQVELISCFSDTKKAIVPHLAIVKAVRSLCKLWKPDVVISFYNDIAALSAVAITGLHIPLIYSERNDPNRTNQRPIDQVYRKIVENRADKIVFQTKGAQACYPPKVQKKSVVILNPLDTSAFPTHDFSHEKKEIVTVGRLEPQKNQKLLINAFSLIADEFPDYNLIIYGEGSLRGELESHIEQLNLQERVLLPGAKEGIQEYIKDASLFVLSSDYEGIPNALIEAMAIGLPCISTDCSPGGARALIDNNVSGVIVPCGDSNELTQQMVRLLVDREFAKKIGRKALDVRIRTGKSIIVDAWIQVLNCGGEKK